MSIALPLRHIALLFVSLSLFGCTSAQHTGEMSHFSSEDAQLRRDIAQMLIVGFRGTHINDDDHIVRDIRDYGVGGVILFEYDVPSGSRPRNISSQRQLEKLCSTLQALSTDPLLIGIDQEGGAVSRLKERYGFSKTLSAQESTRGGDSSVRNEAHNTAQLLHSLGINANFAPCVDVNVNPDCPVIGKLGRSFSSDPEQVARFASIWVDEQNKQDVLSCLKHFPGHGSSAGDTHAGWVDVSESWTPQELLPYKIIIDHYGPSHKLEMIMTTHVFNRQLDSIYPATLSYATLTTLLRDSLGFSGVVVSDDLAMGAMSEYYNLKDVLRLAINAGVDMLCLSNNGREYDSNVVPNTIDLIYDLVKSGELSSERIAESAHRIRQMKQRLVSK